MKKRRLPLTKSQSLLFVALTLLVLFGSIVLESAFFDKPYLQVLGVSTSWLQ